MAELSLGLVKAHHRIFVDDSPTLARVRGGDGLLPTPHRSHVTAREWPGTVREASGSAGDLLRRAQRVRVAEVMMRGGAMAPRLAGT
jgi:hypothetical protein